MEGMATMFFFSLGTLVVTIVILVILIKLEKDVKALRDCFSNEQSGPHAEQRVSDGSDSGKGISAISSIAGKTREAAGAVSSKVQLGHEQKADLEISSWDCSCGRSGNKGMFCPVCGAQRP